MSSSQPFISIDYWLSIADVQIITHYKNRTHNYDYSDEIKSAFVNKQKIIIFLKSDLLETYIPMLLRIEEEFILITGSNDDHCMPYMYFPCRSKELQRSVEKLVNKKQLVLWLTKNRCYEHDKIYPIPLGPKWQWKTTRFLGENKAEHLRIYNQFGLEPDKSMHNQDLKKNLLYFSNLVAAIFPACSRSRHVFCLDQLQIHANLQILLLPLRLRPSRLQALLVL